MLLLGILGSLLLFLCASHATIIAGHGAEAEAAALALRLLLGLLVVHAVRGDARLAGEGGLHHVLLHHSAISRVAIVRGLSGVHAWILSLTVGRLIPQILLLIAIVLVLELLVLVGERRVLDEETLLSLLILVNITTIKLLHIVLQVS